MNKERKILLTVLYFTLLFSFAAMSCLILSDRKETARVSAELLEKKNRKLHAEEGAVSEESIEYIKSLVAEERDCYVSGERADPYGLGIRITEMLKEGGLEVNQYKTLEQEGRFILEFSLHGRSSSFFGFWEELYRSGIYYSVPYLMVKNEKNGISSTFRIGYAEYDKSPLPVGKANENAAEPVLPQPDDQEVPISLRAVSRLFADERTLVTKTEGMKPHSVSEEKTKEPQYTSELRYVSSVTTEGKRFCFFKEEGTGRMLELSPLSDDASWSWVSEETDFFLLEKENNTYMVRK